MVESVLVKVGAESCEFDRHHEQERVGDAEFDAGQAFEDGDDFALVLGDIAVGVLSCACDEQVGFEQDVCSD